ncbi:MAG TPA: COX15/CtaA family protein [Nitrososphaerales archaeon]|nr:COX15/CtaA family protein [Nitrososphaerales archaeon]
MQAKYVLLLLSIAALFTVIVVGAYVTVANFGDACGSSVPQDWPTCLGSLFPPLQLAPIMEYTHRLFAALSTLFLLLTTIAFWRASDVQTGVKKTVYVAMALLIAQVLLGGVVISQQEESILVAAHQGLAVLTFGVAVAAFARSRQPP